MKFELIDENLLQKFHESMESREASINLMQIASELKREGKTQQQVYDIFAEYLEYIVEHGTEEQDDCMRDIMDRIYGWCDPSYRLFDTVLGDDHTDRVSE